MDLDAEALIYHETPVHGKIEVVPTKPCVTQRDLSLAYTPGVAAPCLKIKDNPQDAFKYTAKGNLVAVVSNGTAVLGLGNIGALAGKPVMEGKGVLFKRFAGIDVFDIEVDTLDPDELINIVRKLEPTFGGINLEDIKAPECFYIERKLIEEMEIPVFHDDQHGTAIISGAALVNACEVQGKKIDEVRVVFCGAGAAGIACAKFYVALGVNPENLILVDSKGVVYKGRQEGMNPYKQEFAIDTKARSLADAMKGADVFAGVSVPKQLTPEMVKTMAKKPIIFAMANPTPEIFPDEVAAVAPDAIMATGRSDFPNQVNNVLGFPFIFRGALDVRARKINEEMKLAASHALASLAREEVPDEVLAAYGVKTLRFGPDYIIPKPFDPRVLTWEASAVAEAAVKSGVAAEPKEDFDAYRLSLDASRSRSREFMQMIHSRAAGSSKRIIFPDGCDDCILRAMNVLREEKLALPVLVGNEEQIRAKAEEVGARLDGAEIIDPQTCPQMDRLIAHLYAKRRRKGMTMEDAAYYAARPDWFAGLMLNLGHVDGMVCGTTRSHPFVMSALLQVISVREDVKRLAGVVILLTKDDVYFMADCTSKISPTAEELAETAILTAGVARYLHVEPRVAMLSFSNFGASRSEEADRVREAVEIVRRLEPDLTIDGEMQADTAVTPSIQKEQFPFCSLGGRANVLICPDLSSALISAKLLSRIGGAEWIGPVTVGLSKPVNILYLNCSVEDVVNATAITVIECLDGVL